MNLGDIMQDYLRIAQSHRLTLPHGVTLLGRGLSTLEGLVADLSPETNLLQIVAQRFAARKLKDFDWKQAAGAKRAGGVRIGAEIAEHARAVKRYPARRRAAADLSVRVETEPSAVARRDAKTPCRPAEPDASCSRGCSSAPACLPCPASRPASSVCRGPRRLVLARRRRRACTA